MSIKVAVRHFTSYKYERPIELSPQSIRLRPAAHSRTSINSYSMKVRPANHFINWQQDPFGNYMARVVFPEKVDHFDVDVELIADMVVINPFDFFVEEYAEHFPFEYTPIQKQQLFPYLEIKEKDRLLMSLVEEAKSVKKENTIDYLVGINQLLNRKLKYNIRMEAGVQSAEDSLKSLSGSCRDFAWLFVQLLRHLGLASRFVSGYLIQLRADEKPLEGPSGTAEDFTDLHAWTEVYIPGAGWVGLDATSGLFAGEGHIPLACTPDPQSAAPITGMAEACKTEFYFENKIVRIEDKPRSTKPYTDEVWERIMNLGYQVDQRLAEQDVRLTVGGEPTFVAIENSEAPEWNDAADGEHKRALANTLLHKLKVHFGNGALIQIGQGKWYPGEPLPRWKLSCIWRKDGIPIWHDDELFTNPIEPVDYSIEKGRSFVNRLSYCLGVDQKLVLPAYEDPFYFAWEESKVPLQVDPMEVDLESGLERQKLAQLLQKGINDPVAYVLPIRWDDRSESWQSCSWNFRRDHMFLIPGNSPAGLRLPLKSFQESEELEPDQLSERSQFDDPGPLPDFYKTEVPDRHPNSGEHIFITALIVEIREGQLFIFLPPFSRVEHFLDMVSWIEYCAKDLGVKIIIEGYDPPKDKRIEKFMITPDPGVVEVNIHPAGSWEELLRNYQVLYGEAKASKLSAEKFYLDGRHTGTGGANHITLGAARPEDSPLLRRPDLLKSMVTYWQHHPALSYLFSTQFVGPTSQAPRIDEARNDMLYELEIAFEQIPDKAENEVPFWVVDRIFRNLLVDVTGNTHRAEFCIDKLYSPDTSSGRLGILELRGFEMPPHYRMSMVQFLLIRSLVSWFWREPYNHKLVRWGTALHDRFLLPHFCYKDMSEIVNDLKRAGYDFSMSFFEPFFAFRFPFLGELRIDDIHIELRMAIEPWHVLGEEVISGGTARFVDSSLERLQVKISGLVDSRYQLLCNGFRIPLKNTGVQGEYVAGIRYKAWKPPSSLHPTIEVDTPLVFDLYDTWAKKSIAACQYHVAHPGGRNYQTYPVNSYEAEARRVSRFFDFGHSIDLVEPTVQNYQNNIGRFVTKVDILSDYIEGGEQFSPDFPNTMDLRFLSKRK